MKRPSLKRYDFERKCIVNRFLNLKKFQNQIATNDLAKNTYEQRVNGEPKPIEIAPKEKPVIQPRQKNDLRATGETKIQTNTELSRILVHSEGLRIKPANKIGEVYFTPEIHRLMKNRYSETYKSQAYAW